MPVEELDELGEIRQRPGQPVDLVDHEDVDPPRLDVGEQTLQRRAPQRGAGDAAIVIAGGQRPPAFVLLARDIGRAGLALGVERVERLCCNFSGGWVA